MNVGVDAMRLAKYVSSLAGFFDRAEPRQGYDHMGGTISDSILQAGLNYRTVVEPRVRGLIEAYPEGRTTTGFRELIAFCGLRSLLDWNDPEKPRRIMGMTWLFSNEGLETEGMVRDWLQQPGNAAVLQCLRGVGPKTVDYLKMLVGLPALAVDRHMRAIVGAAGLKYSRYEDVHQVVSLAADSLGVRKDCFDRAIWSYVSFGEAQNAVTSCHP
jgi:hypothetical protein